MHYSLAQSVAPTSEPITTAEAKLHLRVSSDYTDDDAYIDSLIAAARHYVETATNRQLVNATWDQRMDAFPPEIVLRRAKGQSITSIAYIDENGASQTLSASVYQSDLNSVPGRIKPAYGESWPDTRVGDYSAVTVTFVAGYGATAASVPNTIKQAILLLVGQWYENREPVVTGTIATRIPLTVENIIAVHKVFFVHGT